MENIHVEDAVAAVADVLEGGLESISSHFVGGAGGLLMALIAFSIVFLVIIGLMLLMMGLKHFAAAANREKTDAPPQKEPVSRTASESTPPRIAQATAIVSASAEDDELVAVITAAITAATGTAARILSFAPSQSNETRMGYGTSAWRMTGILSNSRGLRD